MTAVTSAGIGALNADEWHTLREIAARVGAGIFIPSTAPYHATAVASLTGKEMVFKANAWPYLTSYGARFVANLVVPMTAALDLAARNNGVAPAEFMAACDNVLAVVGAYRSLWMMLVRADGDLADGLDPVCVFGSPNSYRALGLQVRTTTIGRSFTTIYR